MQTVAEFKANSLAHYASSDHPLDPVDDAHLIEANRILPGDDLRLRTHPHLPKLFTATRKSDRQPVTLYAALPRSPEVEIWKLLHSLRPRSPLVPDILALVPSATLFVVVLDPDTLQGDLIYPGGFDTPAHVLAFLSFWFELHAFLHSHNISLRCLDDWFITSNFLERTEPDYRQCYLYFHQARLLDSKSAQLPRSDVPPPNLFRANPEPPEWRNSTSDSFDPFKSDMFCLGSFVRGKAEGYGIMTPELASLCSKLQMPDPEDRIDAAKALSIFRGLSFSTPVVPPEAE
ncbi:hypothetical protein DFJ73DRAFT_835202 [Zopfochytrium polystomum]|nr:hypothetical protein DFJ73DRAFT_835202 [Zopfochytrium polystomum]